MGITKSGLTGLLRNYCVFGFPVSQKTWDWLGRPLVLDAESGSASEIFLLRKLADQINGKRIHSAQPLDPLHAGQLATVGILVDIFRYIIEIYSHEEQPGVIPRGLERTSSDFGKATVSQPPPQICPVLPAGLGSKREGNRIRLSPKHALGADCAGYRSSRNNPASSVDVEPGFPAVSAAIR